MSTHTITMDDIPSMINNDHFLVMPGLTLTPRTPQAVDHYTFIAYAEYHDTDIHDDLQCLHTKTFLTDTKLILLKWMFVSDDVSDPIRDAHGNRITNQALNHILQECSRQYIFYCKMQGYDIPDAHAGTPQYE